MTHVQRFLFAATWTAALGTIAFAAAPTLDLTSTSVYVGGSITLKAAVRDSDSDLDYVRFEVSSNGGASWTHIGDVEVSGNSGLAQKSWTPPSIGVYVGRATVHDLSSSATKVSQFEVFIGSRTINRVNVPANGHQIFQYEGELITAESPTAQTWVENQGNLILWAGGRVVLKPGFKAAAGSHFWAAIDHDMDGYSDIEEITDTDGDGMPDAWEVDHGLNPIVADASGDLDADGTTNLNEFLNGRNPNDKADGSTLPPSYNLVLKTPGSSYYGLNVSTWVLTGVSAP